MNKLNRKISTRICVVFSLLYLIFMLELTNLKTDDLRESMHNEFMSASTLLFQGSWDDSFPEQSELPLTVLSSHLARHDIHAAAVILDAEGNILTQSNVSNILFNRNSANAVDSNRLADCVRDARNALDSPNFPKGQRSTSMSSSGPEGHTQGWTLDNSEGDARYLFANAKFFESELVVKQMIPLYIFSFMLMGIACLFLCITISRLVGARKIERNDLYYEKHENMSQVPLE